MTRTDSDSALEHFARQLAEDEIQLPPHKRVGLDMLIAVARVWQKEAMELREKVAELQRIVDRSISGLDPER